MAFLTEYRLECDTCREISEALDGAIFSRADVFRELREVGWVRRRGGRTTREGIECPQCSHERREETV